MGTRTTTFKGQVGLGAEELLFQRGDRGTVLFGRCLGYVQLGPKRLDQSIGGERRWRGGGEERARVVELCFQSAGTSRLCFQSHDLVPSFSKL